MNNQTRVVISLMACFTAINLIARTQSRHEHNDRSTRYNRHYYHHDPYRGERMAKGTFGGAATGAFIGGIAGGGRGAGIGLGVGALTGLMAGAAASESHRHDYYEDDGYYYDEGSQERYPDAESDQEEVEYQETSENEAS